MVSWRNFDWLNFLVLILIVCLSTLTILSVNPQLFSSQILYVFFSLLAFVVVSCLDFRIFEAFSATFYILTNFLLLAPFFFGVFSRGAVRWIQIGSLSFQPSEMAKPLLIVFLSKFWQSRNFSFKNIVWYFLLLSGPLFLVFRQPDLGSSLVIFFAALGILFINQINWKHFFLIILAFVLLLPLGWSFLKDYQKQRIEHFINPWKDPLGAGYNLIQSVATVGSGRLTGRGFGRGTQSHLAFLPERHTDFIFASFAEEYGFVGSVFLLFLYFILFRKIILTLKKLKDPFGTSLCFGVFSFLFFQTIVNIGMNLGLLPITGITLPLFSYGGSSLLVSMISLGIVESVAKISGRQSTLEIGVR